jgi:hypothetical protein
VLKHQNQVKVFWNFPRGSFHCTLHTHSPPPNHCAFPFSLARSSFSGSVFWFLEITLFLLPSFLPPPPPPTCGTDLVFFFSGHEARSCALPHRRRSCSDTEPHTPPIVDGHPQTPFPLEGGRIQGPHSENDPHCADDAPPHKAHQLPNRQAQDPHPKENLGQMQADKVPNQGRKEDNKNLIPYLYYVLQHSMCAHPNRLPIRVRNKIRAFFTCQNQQEPPMSFLPLSFPPLPFPPLPFFPALPMQKSRQSYP